MLRDAIIFGIVIVVPCVAVALAWSKNRKSFPVARITDAIKWSHVHSDHETVFNSDGTAFQVLELNGPRYTALASSVAKDIKNRRQQWYLDISGLPLNIQYRTIHKSANIPHPPATPGVLGELDIHWAEALSHTFDTRNYLTISTTTPGAIDHLQKAVDLFIQKCPEFNPRVLSNVENELRYSPLMSYLFELSNGVHRAARAETDDLAERLVKSHVEPEITGLIRQSTDLVSRYNAALSVVAYGEDTDRGVLSALLALNLDFEVIVTSKVLGRGRAQRSAEYRRKQAALKFANEIIEAQWAATIEEIHAGQDTLTETTMHVLPFANSAKELRQAVKEISGVLAASNWHSITEEVLALRAFLSRWPGAVVYDRPRSLSTGNAVDLTPLTGTAKGNTASLWGPSPVRYIPTAGDYAPFALTYHPTVGDDSSPHDVIIAGTRSGKTVFDTFRGAGAHTAHPDLRQVYFDRNGGMRIFTDFMGGQYLTPEDPAMQLNPFDAPDTPASRQLQERLLEAMTQLDSADALRVISTAVKDTAAGHQTYTLSDVYHNAMPEGPVKEALAPWITNERYRSIFGGSTDSFDPSARRITTIALDAVIDDTRLAGVFAFYLLSRIQTGFVANGYPYRITVDEASTLLNDPEIAKLVASEIRTAGKNRGQITTIWQDFGSLHKNSIGDAVLSNAGSLYIWPGTAETAEQCENLGSFHFTETERQFVLGAWRPPRSIRPILLKRHEDSVFLETDLSALGKYLKIFQGGYDNIMRFKQCKQEHPNTWHSSFLDS